MGKEVEKTENQFFDVPCPNCGEGVFTLILKPGVTHRVVCPKCKTAFYVHVGKNLGIIVLRQEEYKKALCPECKGTGKCQKCNGTGEMICPKCKGEGYYYAYGYYPCERCGGMGEYYVLLSGFLEAVKRGEVKLGKGFVRCERCLGSGVCPRCGGEGLILGEE